MPYLRILLTVFLSILWFTGAIPAPASQGHAHTLARASHSALR